MSHLTFKPSKDRAAVPKLVKCLGMIIDAIVILLMIWTIVNMCYPFWGWVIYASIWIGFFSYIPLYWLYEHVSLRSFKTAEYRHNDLSVTKEERLKHLGFLFSVWNHHDSLTLGYYHKNDRVLCRKERTVRLGCRVVLNKWLGWPLVLITNTIPLILLAAVFSAGYFLGIGTIVFFLMGLALEVNLLTALANRLGFYDWDDEMFLEGRVYTRKSVGLVTCILNGPDGELVLTMLEILMFSHFTERLWLKATVEAACPCCMSMMDPALSDYRQAYRKMPV